MLKELNTWQKVLACIGLSILFSAILIWIYITLDPFRFDFFNTFPTNFGVFGSSILFLFNVGIIRIVTWLSLGVGLQSFRKEFLFWTMSFLVPLVFPPAWVSMTGQISNFVASSSPELIVFDLAKSISFIPLDKAAWAIPSVAATIIAIYFVYFRKKEVLDGL